MSRESLEEEMNQLNLLFTSGAWIIDLTLNLVYWGPNSSMKRACSDRCQPPTQHTQCGINCQGFRDNWIIQVSTSSQHDLLPLPLSQVTQDWVQPAYLLRTGCQGGPGYHLPWSFPCTSHSAGLEIWAPWLSGTLWVSWASATYHHHQKPVKGPTLLARWVSALTCLVVSSCQTRSVLYLSLYYRWKSSGSLQHILLEWMNDIHKTICYQG